MHFFPAITSISVLILSLYCIIRGCEAYPVFTYDEQATFQGDFCSSGTLQLFQQMCTKVAKEERQRNATILDYENLACYGNDIVLETSTGSTKTATINLLLCSIVPPGKNVAEVNIGLGRGQYYGDVAKYTYTIQGGWEPEGHYSKWLFNLS